MVQVAAAAGVSYQVARTAAKLGHIDRAALTWHDALVIRAVDELGGNRPTNWSGDRLTARAASQAARDRNIADTVRAALQETYGAAVPDPGQPVADLWVVVGAGDPKPVKNLLYLGAEATEARATVSALPLSTWVEALAADPADANLGGGVMTA
jgi:hypothetical protein